ncbi:hypothetical protein [Bradyrhizobium sp. 6(2017)]|uniref:hypothetical protein n=1 Tax=Bradyrhizobium sp. 6(2017) TaxID=1197460 RepID=UPI0013E1805F|nr:hypothetical protein [Bradyrhizobium sp. 6(2017)]QIG96799.1 hypothetical protein G6P99_33265 [Bradyrhizobium sp. 6(2017)]
MEDEEIEDVIRGLVEEHLDEETRETALEWLETRAAAYQAMLELGLIDKKP